MRKELTMKNLKRCLTTGGTVLAVVASLAACGKSNNAPTAAADTCSSGKNPYETYGTAAFDTVTADIVTRVNAEIAANSTANLGVSFTEIGKGQSLSPPVPALDDPGNVFEGTLAAFLVYAYGGPSSSVYTDGNTYSGDVSMTSAHTGLAITDPQYQYFVTKIVVPALTSNGVSQADATNCFAPAITSATFEDSVINH